MAKGLGMLKSAKHLKIRTDISNKQVKSIIKLLETIGWQFSSLGRPLEDPSSGDTEVCFIKDPVYHRSRAAALRAARKE